MLKVFEEADRIKRRRSLRLLEYDYSQAGAYFLTICVNDRKPLFGEIVGKQMVLNDLGRIVESNWLRTPMIRPQVQLDGYVIMPNHMHGIVVIDGEEIGKSRPRSVRGDVQDTGRMQDAPTSGARRGFRAPSQTVGAVVRGFKGATTSQIAKILRRGDFAVWQRNYYDHVIRDEGDLQRIREYIENNPARWAEDVLNPEKG